MEIINKNKTRRSDGGSTTQRYFSDIANIIAIA